MIGAFTVVVYLFTTFANLQSISSIVMTREMVIHVEAVAAVKLQIFARKRLTLASLVSSSAPVVDPRCTTTNLLSAAWARHSLLC
jgi:hypothetical protein